VEEFFHVLSARGVTIPTAEQARKLAEAVAGIFESFGPALPVAEEDAIATATLAEVADTPTPLTGPG